MRESRCSPARVSNPSPDTQRASRRYLESVRPPSDPIVEARQPIRILDAIKWNSTIRQTFAMSAPHGDRGQHCAEQPSLADGNQRQVTAFRMRQEHAGSGP